MFKPQQGMYFSGEIVPSGVDGNEDLRKLQMEIKANNWNEENHIFLCPLSLSLKL